MYYGQKKRGRGGVRGRSARSTLRKSEMTSKPIEINVGNGRKRKANISDDQFEFPSIPGWKPGKTQKLEGMDFVVHKPIFDIPDTPVMVEFELKDLERFWAMGFNTRFQVKYQFQKKAPEAGSAWVPCEVGDVKNVMVKFNHLDSCIKGIELYDDTRVIHYNDEGRYVAPYLNAFLYYIMDKEQKKLLMPQDNCSGYFTPSATGDPGWSFHADSEWVKKYGPMLFIGDKVLSHDYIPLDVPPFFQGNNYMEEYQKIFPTPRLDNFNVRILFNDHMDYIFHKATGKETTNYRVKFLEFNLVVERLRLGNNFHQTLMARKYWPYPGVTRIYRKETIPAGATIHQAKIQNIPMPEGIFIFNIPNTVVSGIYEFQKSTTGTVFEQHNIKSIVFKYGGKKFYFDEPNIGQITNDLMEKKVFFDYLFSPPFGKTMDPDLITLPKILNNWKDTPYPHVYVNFCNFGGKTRLIPVEEDGGYLNENRDMDLEITYNPTGAAANVTTIMYCFWTDNIITIDTSQKGPGVFSSPYITK